jgi:endoglucanase
MIFRRAGTMAICALLPAMICLTSAAATVHPDWKIFRQRFIEADGRVIDDVQGRISHSEGQGFAMLFAVHHGDRASFDRLWQWTRQHLQVRDDALFAWRWEAKAGVVDKNDASDADLLIAWALLRAGDQWRNADYRAAGLRVAQDIRKLLLRRTAHGLILLPAASGFEKPDGITINLSYWVLPSFVDIARADPAPEWDELVKSGMAILQYARFGRWGLPPNWLKLDSVVAPSEGFPPRFGYDAVRIPIYLLWSHRETDVLLKPYRDFWAHFTGAGFLPSWTSFQDDSVGSYDAGSGVHAVAQWVGNRAGERDVSLPQLDIQQAYYSAALLLLCKMAVAERGAP